MSETRDEPQAATGGYAYSIDFTEEEIAKLKRISELLRVGGGQNPEWIELADWVASLADEEPGDEGEGEDTSHSGGKPKRKKKKK